MIKPMLRSLLAAILLTLVTDTLSAQNDEVSVVNGDVAAGIEYRYTPSASTSSRSNITFGATYDAYAEGLGGRPYALNFLVGPGYSANTGWRLALEGDLYYVTKNHELKPHLLSLRVTASLRGCYGIELDGMNYLVNNRNRLIYSVDISSMPTYLYGLDYATSSSGRRGSYVEKRYAAEVRYIHSFGRVLELGALLDYRNEHARDMDAWASQVVGSRTTAYQGVGIGVLASVNGSRSRGINNIRGVDIAAMATLRPALLSSSALNIWHVEAALNYYQPLWRGALLALDLYGEWHSESTPWMLRAKLGGDVRMRGYYPGQYSGNTLIAGQLELRQHIWQGAVAAAWVGAGTTFSKEDPMAWDKVLPNYGVGLRWHINSGSALRLDVGFGRGCYNFILGFNEAF